jgi:hypothetical protein
MPFSINCWIVGDEPANFFIIHIDDNAKIMDLKHQIKTMMKPRLDNIAVADLELWKVDKHHHDDYRVLVNFVPEGRPLAAVKRLKTLFNDFCEDNIHFAVKAGMSQ